MPYVLIIKGDKRPETIFDDEQFARLLDERLGYDAAQYFRDATDPEMLADALYDISDSELLKKGYCSGECDKVQGTQEHYENLLKEVGELAQAVYDKILEGYTVGGRRTKKEQFAIDKAIEILKVVKQNT
jgi:hypothetical protein